MGIGSSHLSDEDIIRIGITDPDRIRRWHGDCRVWCRFTPGRGKIDVVGSLDHSGLAFDFDAGSVRLSRLDYEDEISIYFERHDLRKDSHTFLHGKTFTLTKRVSFRKRVAISSNQYEHMLRFGGPTMKIEGAESAIQKYLFRPIMLPVGLYRHYEVRAAPSRAAIVGCAKLCQESHGWYGRGINYYIDLWGDSEVAVSFSLRAADCLTHLAMALCSPQLLALPKRQLCPGGAPGGPMGRSDVSSDGFHPPSAKVPVPDIARLNFHSKEQPPPYPEVRTSGAFPPSFVKTEGTESEDGSVGSLHTAQSRHAGPASALAGRPPLYAGAMQSNHK